MSKRSDLITQITTNLSAHSNSVSISNELPFDSGGNPLYEKNPNVLYVDEQQIAVEQLYRTLDSANVNQTTTTINAFLSTDAKNLFIITGPASSTRKGCSVAICFKFGFSKNLN